MSERLEEIKGDWEAERCIKPENVEFLIGQSERVQELEKEFELYDIIHHKIGMTLSNPDMSDDEKWEEVNKLLAEAWESDCIHCNGKGFNGLEACDKCSRGKTLLLEQQNERYRETLEFYANQSNWMNIEVPTMMDGEPEMVTREPLIFDDGGRKAREALEEPE